MLDFTKFNAFLFYHFCLYLCELAYKNIPIGKIQNIKAIQYAQNTCNLRVYALY
jgi:hypothetical protein